MEPLDIRTLVFVSNVASLSMALLFAVITRGERGESRHLTLWAGAFLLKAVGLFLIYLRHSVPDVVSYVLANTMVVGSVQLFLAGILLYAGRSPRWRRQLLLTAITVAALSGGVLVDNYTIFVVSVSLLIVGLELAVMVQLMRGAQPGMRSVQNLVAAAFGMEIAFLVLRMAWYVLGGARSTLFGPDSVTRLFYVQVIVGTMLVGSALLAMIYRRANLTQRALIRDLEQALTEVRTLEGLLPICAWCKKIRDTGDTWLPIESYLTRRTDAQFSHSICPDCYRQLGDGGKE